MNKLLPQNHLLKASSKRVLALILEEIAIDEIDKLQSRNMLLRAEALHCSALELAIEAFGEMNVQTSKHYGNLGRLYQTMGQYKKAESMHQRAISIKEELLGVEDYEVALSIGHLASLYNYDMNEYTKAESLYLRSIAIGEKLFGPSYSGLEYDYKGLIRIYLQTVDEDKYIEYMGKLAVWKQLRDQKKEDITKEPTLMAPGVPKPVNAIISTVLKGDLGDTEMDNIPTSRMVMRAISAESEEFED